MLSEVKKLTFTINERWEISTETELTPSPPKKKKILEQKHTISEMTNSLDRLKNRMKRGEEVSELEDTPIEIIQFF